MMKQRGTIVGVFGTGGFGREVMPLVQHALAGGLAGTPRQDLDIVFVETALAAQVFNGYRVLSEAEFCVMDGRTRLFNIAIGVSLARRDIAGRLEAAGCRPFYVLAASSIKYDGNIIGDGTTLCDNVILTSNVSVGKYFQANFCCYTAHECAIGNFVASALRVTCNGNVRIEDLAYVEAGTVLKQGTPDNPLVIGEGAVVSMGAVPTHTTVVGNPARELRR